MAHEAASMHLRAKPAVRHDYATIDLLSNESEAASNGQRSDGAVRLTPKRKINRRPNPAASRRVQQQGYKSVEIFQDEARSGTSMLGRDGLERLMQRAKSGDFDVLILESLDRLSRDPGDLHQIHKLFDFWGIHIESVQSGKAEALDVAVQESTRLAVHRQCACSGSTRNGWIGRTRSASRWQSIWLLFCSRESRKSANRRSRSHSHPAHF